MIDLQSVAQHSNCNVEEREDVDDESQLFVW